MISQTTDHRGHIIEFSIGSGADCANLNFGDAGTHHWYYTGIHRFTVKASTYRRLESGVEDLMRDFIIDFVETENKKVDEAREKWSDWGSFYWSKGILWGSQTGFAPAIVKGFPLVKLKLAEFKVVSMACFEDYSEMEAKGILSVVNISVFPDLTPKSTTNQANEDDYEYED